MNMHNPAHPGELLTGWLDDLSVSVTAFAAHIGISRVMLSRVMHGHAAMTADMDLRLSEALGTSQGYWLALQTQRDLWTARQTAKERKRIKRMTAPELESARVRGATMTTLRGDGVIGRPVRSRERRVRVPHYPPPICPRLARA